MASLSDQVDQVIRILTGRLLPRTAKEFAISIEWAKNLPITVGEGKRRELIDTICKCFTMTEEEMMGMLFERAPTQVPTTEPSNNGTGPTQLSEEEFEARLPREGWLSHYIEYTRYNEAPMSYHVFASLCLLGSALGSRAYIDKGFFKLWPNYNVVLIGPPALAKSSAADIAKQFITELSLCPVFADKITPEAIVSSLKEYGPHQFIYAPELAVFLGKQRYNEGLITLVNRIMDNPDGLRVRTMARDEEEILGRLTVSFLGATTPFLLSGATPEQTASSGFLSRFVNIYESHTRREFWQPVKGSQTLYNQLHITLQWMKNFKGPVTYTPAGDAFGKEWYERKSRELKSGTDDIVTEIAGRLTKVHFERTAMLLHLADCKTPTICERCFRVAAVLMDYVERGLPAVSAILRKSSRTADIDFILTQLKRAGGTIDHTKLLRACSNRGILSQDMKRLLAQLIEQNTVKEVHRGAMRLYVMGE